MTSVFKKSLLLCVSLISTLTSAITPNFADESGNSLYDWTIRIQTQKLQRQFDYKTSRLNNVDRLDVDYYVRDNDQANYAYESFWYNDGKPLGLERFNPFAIPRGQGVCIKVTHSTTQPTDAELRSAANAIMRIWLESQVNQDAIIAVKIPQQSYNAIVNYLQSPNNGCVPAAQSDPDQNSAHGLELYVESYPSGQSQTLEYM
jgi:hypothetical protein